MFQAAVKSVSKAWKRFEGVLASFQMGTCSFQDGCLLLFPGDGTLLPPKPNFSPPGTTIQPFFSPRTSRVGEDSIDRGYCSISFYTVVLRVTSASSLSARVFEGVFYLCVVHGVEGAVE